MLFVSLLLFFASAHSVKHSLSYFLTASSGISNIPEFIAVSTIDDVQAAYCDSNIKRAEARHKWVKTLLEDDTTQWLWHNYTCKAAHQVRKSDLELLNKLYNKTGGEHVLQRRTGCEWEEGKGIKAYDKYGYDGEDLISFNMETRTWTTLVKEAIITESALEVDKAVQTIVDFLNNTCPQWLKKHLDYGKNILLRTEFPSVSLLQKSPSSPVSCHATGFYPSQAEMFWRRDGVEIHENVNLSEILPNNDNTYQMSADLDVSSVSPEDWGKFDCVFQFLSEKKNMVTKLDKTKIKSNKEKEVNSTAAVVVSLLIVVIVAVAVGFVVYNNRKARGRATPLENDAELCQRLTTAADSK